MFRSDSHSPCGETHFEATAVVTFPDAFGRRQKNCSGNKNTTNERTCSEWLTSVRTMGLLSEVYRSPTADVLSSFGRHFLIFSLDATVVELVVSPFVQRWTTRPSIMISSSRNDVLSPAHRRKPEAALSSTADGERQLTLSLLILCAVQSFHRKEAKRLWRVRQGAVTLVRGLTV